MTQLIAQLKQLAIGDGLHPSSVYVIARVGAAFAIGVTLAALLF